MHLTDLLPIVELQGQRLELLSAAVGSRVTIDPELAISRDFERGLREPGSRSANGSCRMIKASDGWLAVNLARPDDERSVPAWLELDCVDDLWQAIADVAAATNCYTLVERAVVLGLPVAQVGARVLNPVHQLNEARRNYRLSAVDFSALWAGPYCGSLLAQTGIDVTKVELSSRPDPIGSNSPILADQLNGAKRCVTIDGQGSCLIEAISRADILITSGRPHALSRLGLAPETLFSKNPGLLWIAITAHGWNGNSGLRVGFGDDCAAAGGLVDFSGGTPHFIGDAIADPLTGLAAAIAALEAVAGGRAGLFDISLAATARNYSRLAGAVPS